MWARGIMIGTGLAMGGVMLVPGAVASVARGSRAALAMGLAVNSEIRRQALVALAEAVETVEDVVAEVRRAQTPTGQISEPVVVPARAASGGAAVARAPWPVACLSQSERRLRLRPIGLPDPSEIMRLGAEIAAFPGVSGVTHRPRTSSLVVKTEAPAADVLASLRANGVIIPAAIWFRHPAALGTVFALERLDAMIRLRSSGQSDLRQVIAMVLRAVEILRSRRDG